MKIKEVKKEIILSFDESDLNNLKEICTSYLEKSNQFISNDYKNFAKEILNIKL